jgi:predicted nucleic acid-binding protein
MDALVFDTGPLSHFVRADWLGPLKAVVGERQALIPDMVELELRNGAHTEPRITALLDDPWMTTWVLDSDAERAAYAKFAKRLVVGDRNRGEAAVLALASQIDAVAVVDDGDARKIADTMKVRYRPTLALLCDAIREGLLTVPLVEKLADDLMRTKYRLPFAEGGFAAWADEQGML